MHCHCMQDLFVFRKKALNMQKHTDDQVNSIDLVMTHLQIIRSKAYTIHDNRFFLQLKMNHLLEKNDITGCI